MTNKSTQRNVSDPDEELDNVGTSKYKHKQAMTLPQKDYNSDGVWRSTTTQGQRKEPRAQFRAGNPVRVINEAFIEQFDCKLIVTEKCPFNKARWGWDYKLKDSKGVRQMETFKESDLEKWRDD